MLTRAQILAEQPTVDATTRLQLAVAIRASAEYRRAVWNYPNLEEAIGDATGDKARLLNAGLKVYEGYGDGTMETTPTRSNMGSKSSVVADREALVKYLLSALYENVPDASAFAAQFLTNRNSVRVLPDW